MQSQGYSTSQKFGHTFTFNSLRKCVQTFDWFCTYMMNILHHYMGLIYHSLLMMTLRFVRVFISGLSAELYHVSMAIIHFGGSGRPNILSQHHHRRQVELIEKKLWKRREKKKKKHRASAEPGGGHRREDWIQVIKSEPKINLFHQALHLILSVKLFSELAVYSV